MNYFSAPITPKKWLLLQRAGVDVGIVWGRESAGVTSPSRLHLESDEKRCRSLGDSRPSEVSAGQLFRALFGS